MTSISATAARGDLYNVIARVNEECKPITITNSKGKSAVLIGEDEWAAIEETLYLESIPGMVEKIQEGMAEPVEDCIPADVVEW
ncbi:MAG: type II toxin-antitoxin system Phd/YefM family antitoxin [Senegalimassilia sp.]|nr:type II toxin-antitoxin system Phd/YefM family antitoxin [Senegalimassilia sp.]